LSGKVIVYWAVLSVKRPVRHLSDKLRGYDGEVYWSALKPEYQNYRVPIAEAVMRLEGKKYGYVDLLRNLIRPVKINDETVFCSEAVHIALIDVKLVAPEFNNGFALVPGQFDLTGIYLPTIQIY
jgi:hypothetical protein